MLKFARIPFIVSLVLLAYMPFHIFLAQSLSLVTGGLDLWKVGKDVLLMAAVLFTICLVWQQGKATRAFRGFVIVSALYGLLHLLLWVLHPDLHRQSAILGTIYNARLFLFAILGYGATLLLPKFAFSSVMRVVLIVSTIVASLGILQYFLPTDILSHLGYSLERGVRPAFFIDDNPNFLRIMSTLREPNALGAYLVLPSAALTLLLFRATKIADRWYIAAALGVHLAAILLTFSRSAWIAALVALTLVVWWQHKDWLTLRARRYWPLLVGFVVLVAVVGFAARDTALYEQYIVHKNDAEQVADLDSNDYHALLIKQGLQGVQHEPWGHGPGTAGIVSIQNPGGGQLTENYYIQVAYEVGIIGLGLFLAMSIWLYLRLWRRRDTVAIVLCACFWGYIVTNMLLHSWSNEAVAAQWWILAGMAAVERGLPSATKKQT